MCFGKIGPGISDPDRQALGQVVQSDRGHEHPGPPHRAAGAWRLPQSRRVGTDQAVGQQHQRRASQHAGTPHGAGLRFPGAACGCGRQGWHNQRKRRGAQHDAGAKAKEAVVGALGKLLRQQHGQRAGCRGRSGRRAANQGGAH